MSLCVVCVFHDFKWHLIFFFKDGMHGGMHGAVYLW